MGKPSEVEMFTTNLLGESDLNICFDDLNGRIGWVNHRLSWRYTICELMNN